jgi:hypothetical protein
MESREFAGIGPPSALHSFRAPATQRPAWLNASANGPAAPQTGPEGGTAIRLVYDATEFPEEMLSAGLGTRERLLRDQAAKASLS